MNLTQELTIEEQVYSRAVKIAAEQPELGAWDCATAAMSDLFRKRILGQESRDCPGLRPQVEVYIRQWRAGNG